MFKNIGTKIKTLAEITCWIGIAIGLYLGIKTMSKSVDLGVLIILGVALLSWIGSFVLYGYGELIDQTTITNEKLDDVTNEIEYIKRKIN